MTQPAHPTTPLWRATREILRANQAAVGLVVDGLDEAAAANPVLPSGWTVAGMVEHLAWMETVWFQGAIAGRPFDVPWPPQQGEGPYVTEHTLAETLAFLRTATGHAEDILDAVGPDDLARGRMPDDVAHLAGNVGLIVVHVIEELARHLGHLDVARELLDGRTGLGPR